MEKTVERELRGRYQFLPKDFVETEDGLLLAVVAPGLEDERIISTLRYRRDPNRLSKLSTLEGFRLLSEMHADWLRYTPDRDSVVPAVPVSCIVQHRRPSVGLKTLLRKRHPHAAAARHLMNLIHQPLGSPAIDDCGVTGSSLLGTHQATSDVDFVVYGRENFNRVRAAVSRWLESGAVQALTRQEWQTVYERRGCDLSFNEYFWHEHRKCNKFLCDGVRFDLSCVCEPDWRAIAPGRKKNRLEFETRVIDDRAAFDSPAVYAVDHSQIAVVVSHTPTYTGQARNGETIRVSGWLECCESFQRVIVGSSREASGEFIKLVESAQLRLNS